MQLLEVIKEIILDNQKSILFTGITRHTSFDNLPGKASICIGVRRSGKSTLLYQKVEMAKKEYGEENILFLNFFDDRLTELRTGNLHLVMEAFYSLYPQKKGERIFCFFDELQECKNWEPFVDRTLKFI